MWRSTANLNKTALALSAAQMRSPRKILTRQWHIEGAMGTVGTDAWLEFRPRCLRCLYRTCITKTGVMLDERRTDDALRRWRVQQLATKHCGSVEGKDPATVVNSLATASPWSVCITSSLLCFCAHHWLFHWFKAHHGCHGCLFKYYTHVSSLSFIRLKGASVSYVTIDDNDINVMYRTATRQNVSTNQFRVQRSVAFTRSVCNIVNTMRNSMLWNKLMRILIVTCIWEALYNPAIWLQEF